MLLFRVLFSTTVLLDMFIAVLCFFRKNGNGKMIGSVMGCASLTSLWYMLGSLRGSYVGAAFFFGLHFSFMTAMLVCLLAYIVRFTDQRLFKPKIMWGLHIIAAIDVTVEMLNVVTGMAMRYERIPLSENTFKWVYHGQLPFTLHLTLAYALVGLCFFFVIRKLRGVPSVYAGRYTLTLAALIVVVLLNALFLFLPGNRMFDYSILLYSMVGVFMYWNEYYYSNNAMLDISRRMIFDETNYPILLFDYEDRLVTRNPASRALFGENGPGTGYTMAEFLLECGLENKAGELVTDQSFQITRALNGERRACTCSVYIQRDKRGQVIGRLFTIRDRSLEIDMLTGFETEIHLYRKQRETAETGPFPISLGLVDINALVEINNQHGRAAGDQAIQLVAELMRECFPEGRDFVRMQDANLVVLCPGMNPSGMTGAMERLKARIHEQNKLGFEVNIQYAVTSIESADVLFQQAHKQASRTLMNKKLMDTHSTHTSLLDSLAQIQTESDVETEEHVVRTKEMGQRLGKRIGLSDGDMVRLALLCLLHDIGKVGIPLDILTKPGALSEPEWFAIKSHVEKGYRIAKASKELENIAELILYHHECWDGSGYPDGLKQEAIPLLSRIIAVVDAYDAMTNDRPYRKALSEQKARAELQRCAGTMFDPGIVREFLAMLEETEPFASLPQDEPETVQRVPMSVIDKEAPLLPNKHLRGIVYTRYILDDNNAIVEADENFTGLTGYVPADWQENTLRQIDLIPIEDRENYESLVRTLLPERNIAFIEHRLRCKDGLLKHVFCYGRVFYDSALRVMRSEVIVTDIADMESVRYMLRRQKASSQRGMQRFEQAARMDSMTGILNHEAYQNEAERIMMTESGVCALAITDVDWFKRYNDTHGHPAGDELLKQIASALKEAAGETGIAGRMGGDELSLFLIRPEGTSREELAADIGRIWQKLGKLLSGFKGKPTLSMGVAFGETKETTFKKLYAAGDHALYEAKAAGRGRYIMDENAV